MITEYQQKLRERYLAANVMPAPEPWQPVMDRRTPIGGVLGMGFAVHPDSGHDLIMVVSSDGHGLLDAVTGEQIARDRDPDPETSTPDAHPDLTCPGLGPIEGVPVRMAGLFGGGLHSTTPDGWTLDVVSPRVAPRPRHSLRRRRVPQRPDGRDVVARLPLRVLRTPSGRVLSLRPDPGGRHQQ